MSFDNLPSGQQAREIKAANDRAHADARREGDKIRAASVAARRPGLQRPGERQLKHAGPAFRQALFGFAAATPEAAKALVDAMREAESA